MELPTTFGEWLSQNRKSLRLTRDELAKRVGCSVSALRKFENGQRRPSGQIAELLANSLNIPPGQRPTFVKVARGELGVDRLSDLMKAAPELAYAAPPAAPRTNLPILPTPMIGRQREVAELSEVLRDPQCRLLILVGPGGIGKTRLAIETAMQLQDAFPDGACLVPLVSVSSARFIIPVIADAIGFSFQANGSMDPKAQLLGYLREKQALLLVDNLEHLLADPGIEVLTDLLAAAPHVKLLVTSRESPGLPGQWIYEVQGLPIPAGGSTREATENTSVELFLQRARRAHVSFSFTAEDYPAIVRICQFVQGMPLAIELASAWVRTLSCPEIEQEIERGLDFLRVSTGEFPPRHRSLRAVFDQSWKLLTAEEQLVLVRLSVFRGGFRREAAEQVAQATLSLLNMLVSKSLVRRSEAGRYDLHELIRQFAAEQCAECQDEQMAAREDHARYYLRFFAQADAPLRTAAQQEMLAEMTAEMGNFRLAWDWAIAHGDFGLIEETLRAFIMLYDTRSWYQEGIETLGRAIDALEMAHGKRPADRTNQLALGHLLTELALLTYRLGHHASAQAMLERSLAILRPLHDPAVVGEPLSFLGTVLNLTGQFEAAAKVLQEGRSTALAVGDKWVAAMCLALWGSVAMHIGQYDVAYERLQGSVAELRALGDPRFTAFALNHLARTALRLAHYSEARVFLTESVALNISVGARWNLGHAYQGMAEVAQAQGQHAQAVEMFGKSVETFTELGGRFYLAESLSEMGRSVFALGNDAEAERIWHESLCIAMEVRGMPVAAEALLGLAGLEAKKGNRERALELLFMVLSHAASSEETKNRAGRLGEELRALLTRQQIRAVQARAQAASFDAVVKDLMGQT